jgi:ferrochelatase
MKEENCCIILANLGAPSNQKEVYPFLRNLFSDGDIFRFPFGNIGQMLFSWLIATTRAPKSRKYYRAIGGGSPLQANTEAQAKKLQQKVGFLKNHRVYVFQRYWYPFANEVVGAIKNKNFTKIIVIPLYPHYSTTTTRSIINEWKRCAHKLAEPIFVERFYQRSDYIKCCVEQIEKKLSAFNDDPHILFSAHSIPEKRVLEGDPYKGEIEDHMKLIMNALHKDFSYSLCYQSRVGPVKWLEPNVEAEVDRLISEGVDRVMVVPISFVSENLETLFELDIQKKRYALSKGITQYERADTVQDSGSFIEVLYNIVMEQ